MITTKLYKDIVCSACYVKIKHFCNIIDKLLVIEEKHWQDSPLSIIKAIVNLDVCYGKLQRCAEVDELYLIEMYVHD